MEFFMCCLRRNKISFQEESKMLLSAAFFENSVVLLFSVWEEKVIEG